MTKKTTIFLALILLAGVISLPASAEAKDDDNNPFKSIKEFWSDDERLPPGLRRAPGIEKRVESGKGLPFGWFKKLSGGTYATSTKPTGTSTLPFFISHINSSVGTSTAVISWKTTSASDSRVYYSTTSPATSASAVISNASLVSDHALALNGLAPNTTYYYLVASANATKSATSSNKSLTTKPLNEDNDEASNIILNALLNLIASSSAPSTTE